MKETPANIIILALDGCLASSIGLPKEMLSAANDFARVTRSPKRANIQIAGKTRQIECAGGITLRADLLIKELSSIDLVIIPALWRNPLTAINKQEKIIQQLPDWYAEGAQICAVGSASFLLAEAGLLDQRAATTHWVQAELFSRRYPLVKYQKDFLITQSDRIYCAASVNALADLTIHFVEQIYGKTCAQHVETNFSPEARTPFSANVYNEPTKRQNIAASDSDIARLTAWLRENISSPFTNQQLANLLNTSERSFSRRFKKVMHDSPQNWLTTARMNHAKKLLKNTSLPINDIAIECGYVDRNHFDKRFKQHVGHSPAKYRDSLLKNRP